MTMTAEPPQGSTPTAVPPPRELDLFAFALMLVRHIPFIIGCGLLAFGWMLVAMLRAKPRFAATAVMIVPQGNVTSANLASQLSLTTADLLGGGYELYADIIKSHRVEDPLIADFNLQKVYGTARLDDTEDTLDALTAVATTREGVVRVTVQDTDPKRAADLANGFLRELDLVNKDLVLTSIGLQAAYLHQEMTGEKNALADAEVALKEVQIKTGGLPPDAQAGAGLSALETTRAQLRADQIHLSALLTSETDSNPEVVRLRSQIASESAQVESLQMGSDSTLNGTPTTNIPAQALEYTRQLREVKFHETLFDLLASQYEQAKEQEAKNPSIVQVLDAAKPSTKKAWPPRTYYCLMALVVGLVVGVFLVTSKAVVMAYVRNPNNAPKIEQLKTLYRWPRRVRA